MRSASLLLTTFSLFTLAKAQDSPLAAPTSWPVAVDGQQPQPSPSIPADPAMYSPVEAYPPPPAQSGSTPAPEVWSQPPPPPPPPAPTSAASTTWVESQSQPSSSPFPTWPVQNQTQSSLSIAPTSTSQNVTQASSSTSAPLASSIVATANGTLGTIVNTTVANQAAASAAAARYPSSNYTVVVGGDSGLVFSPPNMNGIPSGSIVTFEFHSSNHSVVRSSSFLDPCTSLQGDGAFDSGFHPVDIEDASANASTSYPTFTVKINDTAPVFFYCSQLEPTSHCGNGMVGVINVQNATESYAAFRARAIAMNGTSSPSARQAQQSASSTASSGASTTYGMAAEALKTSQSAIIVLSAWTVLVLAATGLMS